MLDQRRDTPVLADQMAALRDFAKARGICFAFVSQIDRAYDPGAAALPGIADLRLPNPVPVELFDAACFTHGGRTRIEAIN